MIANKVDPMLWHLTCGFREMKTLKEIIDYEIKGPADQESEIVSASLTLNQTAEIAG